MPKRPRYPMPMELRAKQFAPFRALVGLEEALARVEEEPVPRPRLSEEVQADMDRKLQRLQQLLNAPTEPPRPEPESRVTLLLQITWYQNGQIHRTTDELRRIDPVRRYLYFRDHNPIYLDDLLHIQCPDVT